MLSWDGCTKKPENRIGAAMSMLFREWEEKEFFNQKTDLYFEVGMINPEDIIYKNENKFEVGMIALAWRNSEMKDCKVKIVEENEMWYLLKDKS
jgi:hypothetical protein